MSSPSTDPKSTNIDPCGSELLSPVVHASIAELSSYKTFKKGDVLIREGQVVDQCFYVINGCLRKYRLIDGQERTIFFFTEDQSVLSFSQTTSIYLSNFYVDCLEDTSVSIMTSKQEEELYRRHPEVESMARISLEKMIRDFHEIYSDFVISTPEERYLQLLHNRPDLLKRVPQYHLASYLGVKPESLSRIRRRLASKEKGDF